MTKVFAIDHGNGAVKMRTDVFKKTLPAIYSFSSNVGEALSGGKMKLKTYKVEGTEYVWGDEHNQSEQYFKHIRSTKSL